MTVVEPQFSARDFLRDRQVLLVHFSTKMSKHRDVLFPADLRRAKGLRGRYLSFSTFGACDRGIDDVWLEAESHAAGYVGLVVDIRDVGSIYKVCHEDVGSFEDPPGTPHSNGDVPSLETCASSIDNREGTNEWYVKDFIPKGIFLVDPEEIQVRQVEKAPEGLSEEDQHLWGDPDPKTATFQPYDVGQVFNDFPSDRIFSRRDGGFIEWDRTAKIWSPVTYEEIVAP